MVCALKIRKATNFSSEEVYLYVILAVDRIWLNTDLQLFGFNLQILVSAEIASELLGLMC